MGKSIKVWKVRLENLDDFYPTYKNWSEHRKFPVVHRDNLEEVFVCSQGGVDVYCCFVWNTGSKMCMIGFPVGNPLAPREIREGGLKVLFEQMAIILRKRGYTKIWTTSGTPPVEKALLQNQFINADPGVNVYIKLM